MVVSQVRFSAVFCCFSTMFLLFFCCFFIRFVCCFMQLQTTGGEAAADLKWGFRPAPALPPGLYKEADGRFTGAPAPANYSLNPDPVCTADGCSQALLASPDGRGWATKWASSSSGSLIVAVICDLPRPAVPPKATRAPAEATAALAAATSLGLLKNDDFPLKNDDFPLKNDDFPLKNDDFPLKNGNHQVWWRSPPSMPAGGRPISGRPSPARFSACRLPLQGWNSSTGSSCTYSREY